ncbi:MarR family winged helix-turn-helix transcriptional regulator [Geminicoccaceae bacterium 1502E]|nr:MarR family winged helix-turn-helix transcriptional regulator [Geminicoccaceae bacterium 1502E]
MRDTLGMLCGDVARLLAQLLVDRAAARGLALTLGEARTLLHLNRLGPTRSTDLAESMGVEVMTAVRLVDGLEARRLVERHPDPRDRRAKQIVLAAAAADVLARFRELSAELRAEATDGVPAAEMERALEALEAVRCNLRRMRAARPRGACA